MKLLQTKVKIDEIHEIFPLSYEYGDGLGREIMELTRDNYSRLTVLPKTFDPDGKGMFIGSNSYSKPMLYNVIRGLVKDESLFLINPQYSEIGLRNFLLTQEHKQEHPGFVFTENGKTILVRGNLDNPRQTYEDLVFCAVYPKQGQNPNLWKNIREQVLSDSKYKNNIDLSLPFIVKWPLDFEEDDDIENDVKVIFDKDGLTQVYNVPILNQSTGNFDENDSSLLETGLPSKLGEGERTLYNSDVGGVFRFNRDWDLDLSAWDGDLAGSYGDGRVHVARKIPGNNLEVKVSPI